tara:strand:+ start:62 stop:340 length:279 start_codon:yes stop_codon:yes gene_type:complete
MNQKLIKFIVILLGCLIIISFIAIIYGSYLALTKNNDYIKNEEISLDLKKNEIVKDLKNINEKYILIELSGGERIGILYDIKNNKIIRNIKR